MAKNDIILVDGIVDQRIAENIPSALRDEVFEYLVLGELLRDYDPTPDDIEFGWIDGDGDGGLDGFFVFINGHLVDDVADFVWPKSSAAMDVWLVTCKHHATFQQAPLDSMLATINELFDFRLEHSDLRGRYSENLLDSRDLLMAAYRRLSITRPTLTIHVVYASRGDSDQIGESVAARAKQIEGALGAFFSSSIVRFRFFGAAEIVESLRKVKAFSLELPFIEHLATGKGSYVLLVRLGDYWKFVSDEAGNLRRYLFDSNVRDFLGANSVNEDIARSLADADAPDFWWLNNGVTILATNATIPGKIIQVQDIQIVNGLQTTETIFKHFTSGSLVSSDRALLVKIIVATDSVARDRIIQATNNQSPVDTAALRATDRVQRDIEQILERHGWYYERRRNYYKNIGKPAVRFVLPTYLASAVVALIFKTISVATRIRPKFMRDQVAYDDVFSTEHPLEIWPVLVGVFKFVDAQLAALIASQSKREKLIGDLRPLISLLVVAKKIGTFAYKTGDLVALDVNSLTASEVKEAWDEISTLGILRFGSKRIKVSSVLTVCEAFCLRYNITGIEEIERRHIKKSFVKPDTTVSDELVEAVDSILPKQPWKPGVHRDVALSLRCSADEASAAIQLLIASGRRYSQRDGVVYDADGMVVAADAERVRPAKSE